MIRAIPQHCCMLCGSEGTKLHEPQDDRLFGAAGEWAFRRCHNPVCRAIWLDPAPVAEDLFLAYAQYYTHSPSEHASRHSTLASLLGSLRSAYLSDVYGYGNGRPPVLNAILTLFLRMFPLRCAETKDKIRHLASVKQGNLLDVGCGSGQWLDYMRGLGWQVVGLDFDRDAVEECRRRDLDVRVGGLLDNRFEVASFDAVTMHHVIEHIPEPIDVLRDCARILRPGGRLVVSTPNADSLSHRFFGRNWRGLEPPRHLCIFTEQALRDALRTAGFKTVSIRHQVASSVIYESLLLKHGHRGPEIRSQRYRREWLLSRAIASCELALATLRPSMADCLTAIART